MSTHTFRPKMGRGVGRLALSVLGGVLIALQLLLASIAFAFSPSAPIGTTTNDPTKAVAQAGVSVVRLVVTYTPTGTTTLNPPSPSHGTGIANTKGQAAPQGKQCTGLGVLIRSWTAVAGEATNNNWVLTDGSLLTQNTCNPGAPIQQPSGIQVFASTAFSGTTTTSQPVLLGSLTNPAPADCQATPCSNGAALFSFSTNATHTLPYIDPAPADSNQPQRIGLTNGAGASAPSVISNEQQIQPFLTPNAIASQGSEAGTPLVDTEGNLVGMHLLKAATNLLSFSELTNIEDNHNTLWQTAAHKNILHDKWNIGIDKYYGNPPDYTGAKQAFQAAQTANPEFRAANLFQHLAAPPPPIGAKATATAQARVTATAHAGNGQRNGIFPSEIFGIPIWLVSIGALVVLIVFLVLVNQTIARRGAQRRRADAQFKAEQEEARRRAAMTIPMQGQPPTPQQMSPSPVAPQQMQIQPTRKQKTSQAPPQPVAPVASTPPAAGAQPPTRELPCPNCGKLVKVTANFCPHCNTALSPSASGLHLWPTPPSAVGATEPAGGRNAMAASVPPPPPPQLPITEQPTVAMPTGNGQTGQPGPIESERTQPFPMQQFQARNLSLAVGTRSDPGIKRKHKPNEDSLLAVKGERAHDSQPQQFGLFVVADGMGGHANGQDASRLAIQTIIDFALPPLSSSDSLDGNTLQNLLLEGVQRANQAVYQHNQEQRGDSGTTMTAALIVGLTAYIANVGDSRTYLYREGEGLKKVTQDHSVVASLVEAGIIKPDDIYTHPKRNQIYRSLGEKPSVEVDTFRVDLQMGDKLLLCSDGLWDMVRDPTIEQIISRVPNPEQTGSALIKAALEGGGEDNVSVIVVHVTEGTQNTGVTGTGLRVELVDKPDTVTVPTMPK